MNRKFLPIVLVVLLGLGGLGCNLTANLPISQKELLGQIEARTAPVILDVRSAGEYNAGHIPGAINIEYRQLPQRLNELPTAKGQPIVVYCETGVRATIANATLKTAGYTPIFQLTGHMKAWRTKGFPINVISKD